MAPRRFETHCVGWSLAPTIGASSLLYSHPAAGGPCHAGNAPTPLGAQLHGWPCMFVLFGEPGWELCWHRIGRVGISRVQRAVAQAPGVNEAASRRPRGRVGPEPDRPVACKRGHRLQPSMDWRCYSADFAVVESALCFLMPPGR